MGSAPVLLGAAFVGSLSGVIPANFDDLGFLHVLFVLVLIASYCVAVVSVAVSVEHKVRFYLGSGAVYTAMIFGFVNFVHVFFKAISAL